MSYLEPAGMNDPTGHLPSQKFKSGGACMRPARGYHTFKNGCLNVSPKGAEKELVQANQQSPLLRLPTELRTKIWSYVLGSTIYRGKGYSCTGDDQFVPRDRSISLTLLQTCRQIYSETTMLPFTLNIFSVGKFRCIRSGFKLMKLHQRRSIKHIRLELDCVNDSYAPQLADMKTSIEPYFPSLETVEVFVYSGGLSAWTSFPERFRPRLEHIVGDKEKLVFEDFYEKRPFRLAH
ncbi:hypothetical protein G6514_005584 [Epicoccum nigrum]|nr:hypothetical protein G6514_005584 [Epicoccum nigrum]